MKNKLTTVFSESLDKENPHSYYPRPMMKRDSFFSLNGKWELGISESEGNFEYEYEILVPFPPESTLSGIERIIKKDEYLHYRKTFTLPEGFVNKRTILHFGAVDTVCRVYLNGKFAGENEGGYIPFSFDVSELLSESENVLTLTVKDGIDKNYPYGKQRYDRGGMWYTPVSGIWQSVWLESLPDDAIESIRITPTPYSARIEVKGGKETKRITLTGSNEAFEFSGDEFTVRPTEIRKWTPETPYLYHFILESGEDKIESYFALRRIDIIEEKNGVQRVLLNDKPYVFNGLLDQGYYPDGIFLPATEEGYLYDIRTAKELGFNMLRKHIKIEPEIFYYLCDREGIAVFQDMVNNSDYSFLRDTALPTVGIQKLSDKSLHKSAVSRRIFISEMKKTIEHLYNHPSILYWTIFNEGWGQFDSDSVYLMLKSLDGTRIIDSTSGWFRRSRSDVDSRHIYFKPLKVRGRNKRPLCISEFGGYSLRIDGHVFGKDNYGYKTYKTTADFEDAFINLYKNEVKPIIKKGAFAFVYTQLSDVEDETNGIMTYDRRVVKLSPAAVRPVFDEIFKCEELTKA